MKLKTITFDKNSMVTEAVRKIYEDNFPENERTPFEDLFAGEFARTTKAAYLLDGKVIGLTIYYKENNLIYLIWFAVDKELQGKGIGTQILKTLSEENKSCGIAGNIENPNNPKCKDKDARLKREKFYIKNGFKPLGILFDCFNEEWKAIALGKVDSEKYMKIEASFYPNTHNIRKLN